MCTRITAYPSAAWVPLGRDLAGQAPELDEALGQALVEGVPVVVRRQVEVVERRSLRRPVTTARPPCRVSRMSPETWRWASADERVEGPLQRGEPQAVVDQLAPPLVDAALEPRQVALDGHVLELLVGGDQRDRPRRLVDLAALDADEPVLDHVEPADALRAGAAVQLRDGLQHGDRLGRRSPSGRPSTKVITTSSASRGTAGSAV